MEDIIKNCWWRLVPSGFKKKEKKKKKKKKRHKKQKKLQLVLSRCGIAFLSGMIVF